jgi:hypothetical protein
MYMLYEKVCVPPWKAMASLVAVSQRLQSCIVHKRASCCNEASQQPSCSKVCQSCPEQREACMYHSNNYNRQEDNDIHEWPDCCCQELIHKLVTMCIKAVNNNIKRLHIVKCRACRL